MTAEQLHVIRSIKAEARRRYGNDPARYRRYLLTGLEIGQVETHFQNLSGGDADSAGFRQERHRYYKDPTNLSHSIGRMFDEMERADHGQPTGQLAQAIQRSAFPERYQQALPGVRRLAGGGGGSVALATGQPGHVVPGRAPRLIPGSPEGVDHKAAMLAAVTDPRKNMSLLERFKQAVQSGQYTTPAVPAQVVPGKGARYIPGQAGGSATNLEQRAQVINDQHLPYKWGGGHQGRTSLHDAVPLDCSGAVSKLLGINPRVAAEFKKFGKPGRGHGLTIWASDTHVLVEIGGHFWGTSAANPGGGAGWIPRSQISQAYLSRFTPRHM